MKSASPPRLAKRIFIWYCGAALVDDLVGDLDEIFLRNATQMPLWRAKYKYWFQVISLISSYAIRKRRQRASLHPHSNDSINFHMIRNYFLIAWRVMTRNTVYTIINVLGLTLGISACIVVYLVVSHELSFDKFHPDGERIFRLNARREGEDHLSNSIASPLYITLRDQYVGPETIAAYFEYGAKVTIGEGDHAKHFDRNSASIVAVDPSYFKIFQYNWIAGNMDVLAKPGEVVLTERRAQTYFGDLEPQDILGKSIAYNDSLILSVGGIVKDWKENSDFKRTEFISLASVDNPTFRNVFQLDNWGVWVSGRQGFVKINPGDNPEEVAKNLSDVLQKQGRKISLELQPLSDIHFRSNKWAESELLPTLYTLSGLAVFILIIAAINFINLATAQSVSRGREIGLRKVMGGQKVQIVVQFLSETLVVAFIALCLSLALVRPMMFLFGSYIPSGVTFELFSLSNWLFFGGLLFVVAIIAGIYPALVMSSYVPAVTLSGRKISSGFWTFSLRKTLIVFQFSASLFFIIATLVITRQMNFIKEKDRGFSTSSVITVMTPWEGAISKVEALTERIRQINGADNATMQWSNPMGIAFSGAGFEYSGKKDLVTGMTSIKAGDDHFIPLYKVRLIAGRNISPSDTVNEIVINEKLSKTMGFETPIEAIGEHLKVNKRTLPIVGVVQDFHQMSFRVPMENCVIGNFRKEEHSIGIRLESPDLAASTDVITKIESEFKQIYPDEPFGFQFVEDEIAWMHQEEQKTSNLATIAMAVTIFISCMGVFGLAMFTAAMRTREIGIRKVLGASTVGIVNMLSREFTMLIVISIVIATPIAWYYMNDWLHGFTYRTDLSWWLFIAAGAIALLTGLITVSYQSFKAATSDPVKALRTE